MKVNFEYIQPDANSSFKLLVNDYPVENFEWEYHYHPEIELVCVTKGNGTRHIGFHESTFVNGDLVLIGANIPHSGFGLNANNPHHEIVVQIKQEILMNQIELAPELANLKKMIFESQYGIVFGEGVKKRMKQKILNLTAKNGSKRYISLMAIMCELSETDDYELLNTEIMPYNIIKKNGPRLEKIFTYVENHYNDDISIGTIANETNLTEPAFCNFFKKTTHMTFIEFVNRFRINKACMLITEGKSISEVCYDTGFKDLSYFNRVFKKYTKLNPSAFQKQFIS